MSRASSWFSGPSVECQLSNEIRKPSSMGLRPVAISAMNCCGVLPALSAPIMIAADKAGKTPQQFIAEIATGRKPMLDGFRISFDNWHSTDGPENHELARDIYLQLRKEGLIAVKSVEQFFDPVKEMFLPDRYIKGE